jgi:hypothetical protein
VPSFLPQRKLTDLAHFTEAPQPPAVLPRTGSQTGLAAEERTPVLQGDASGYDHLEDGQVPPDRDRACDLPFWKRSLYPLIHEGKSLYDNVLRRFCENENWTLTPVSLIFWHGSRLRHPLEGHGMARLPSRNGKPPKPDPEFPLFAHATGRFRFLATRLWPGALEHSLRRQYPTQPMAPTNIQMHGPHHSAPQYGGFLLALFAALSIGVATGCRQDADATTDYSEPMQVWTVHGIQVHDQMTPSQVSAAMGASLEEVVTIRSDDTLRGKGATYIHSCKGHAFYFFKKDATNPDEPV